MSLQVGQPAPDFSLFDNTKNKVTLSELRGKNVLLMFFPQAFTGFCTKQICTASENLNQYESSNAVVLGISVDSVNSLAKFKELEQIKYPLLSDFNKDTSRAYECIYENWVLDMKGVSKRAAFIIDENGILQYVEVLESPADMPNFEKIQEVLNGLR